MIIVDVEDYCKDCGLFDPMVERGYFVDEKQHKRVKNVVKCKFQNECKKVIKTLKSNKKQCIFVAQNRGHFYFQKWAFDHFFWAFFGQKW